PRGFMFNMSVGYDFDGITSRKIDEFINGLKDSSPTNIWTECKNWAKKNLSSFRNIDMSYIDAISANICGSVTLSTLHGCPSSEIEKIAAYLLDNKGLNTFIKCNPTLVGYDFARKTLDSLGYQYISFDDRHFKNDLQYDEAVPMIKRLMSLATEKGLTFGVKLTNTFPVDNTKNIMSGEEMYMSGRPLFPLTAEVARKLSLDFGGDLPISWSGGVDYANISELFRAGIWPLTIATALLKPGGYLRLKQMAAEIVECFPQRSSRADIDAVKSVAEASRSNSVYVKKHSLHDKGSDSSGQIPLFDCFSAPCVSGCPFGQDIPQYICAVERHGHAEALRIILAKNPLPFITGTICYHNCMNGCTRNFYDEPVNIRSVKLEAAENGIGEVMRELMPTELRSDAKAAIVGGGPSGLAAAYFLRRGGIDATVYEKETSLGGVVRKILSKQGKISEQAIESDISIVKAVGVGFVLGEEVASIDVLRASGYKYVVLACGNAKLNKNKQFLMTPSSANGDCSLKTDIENVYMIGDMRHLSPASVAEAISDARAVSDEIAAFEGIVLGFGARPCKIAEISPISKKGVVRYSCGAGCEAERCLNCSGMCENCIDVCPNRANVAVRLEGEETYQIVHIDSLCNECGNCAAFCPWNGTPYKQKFTYFANENDFNDSKNHGLWRISETLVKVRLAGKIFETDIDSDELPERISKLIKAAIKLFA
ncbi:MAG: NAD(P)-binding protein, partial [Synergistaceae bacterium]|nr:NAD(P)-binding protein [Synergistaceae bacterium]